MASKFPKNPSRSYGTAPKGDSVHRPETGAMHPSQPCCSRAMGTGGSQQHQDRKAKGAVPAVPCPEMAAGPDLLQWMWQDGSPPAKMLQERIAQHCLQPLSPKPQTFSVRWLWQSEE